MLGIEDYQKEQGHPQRMPVMYQKWHHLLFLHAPVSRELVQGLIPHGLEVDTYLNESDEEQAWVSLVLYTMKAVRPKFLPALPGLSEFHEFNFRTYVHHQDRQPGIYFFSLDAANSLACTIARRAFGLSYFHARMSVGQPSNKLAIVQGMPACSGCVFSPEAVHRIEYRMDRRGKDKASLEAKARIGFGGQPAVPGSLDFFLVERYRFYSGSNVTSDTASPGKMNLGTGQVWHRPYQLTPVGSFECTESVSASAGLPDLKFTRAHFCQGVDVEVFSPSAVRR